MLTKRSVSGLGPLPVLSPDFWSDLVVISELLQVQRLAVESAFASGRESRISNAPDRLDSFGKRL